MLSALFKGIQKLSPWRCVQATKPDIAKAVVIFAPHTSNWDFWTMVVAKFIWSMKVRYLGKDALFKAPHGWLFKSLGGIPVDRSKATNMVDQVVNIIESSEHCHLAIAPEGTRSYTDYWKTGFYHIANRANVPIIMFYLDTKTHTIGYSEPFYTTGDIEADFKVFADFYQDKIGFIPEQTSLVQTRDRYKASLDEGQ